MVSIHARLVRQWHRDASHLRMLNEYHQRLVLAYRNLPGPQRC